MALQFALTIDLCVLCVGARDRTADMTTSHQLEAIAPEISGKGTSVCADFELENAEPGNFKFLDKFWRWFVSVG